MAMNNTSVMDESIFLFYISAGFARENKCSFQNMGEILTTGPIGK